MESTKADRDEIKCLEGFFVGSLNEDETASFSRCVSDGVASSVYEGTSGFLGLGKVKVLKDID